MKLTKDMIGKRYTDKCGNIYLIYDVNEGSHECSQVMAYNERTQEREYFNIHGRYSIKGNSIFDLQGEVNEKED